MRCHRRARARVLASVLLAFAHALAHAAPCSTLLHPPVSFGCGSTPQEIALGDLDHDGRLDAVIANGSANTFSVLRGAANGGFGAATVVATGVNARAATLADLDEDGELDLLLAMNSGVQRWRGNGNATFTLTTTLAAGTTVRAIVVADLDADGILDIATANNGANEVQVLIAGGAGGRPDGSFAAATHHAVGAGPVRLVACDLDRDGALDLVSADNAAGTVSVLRALTIAGKPTGGFAASVRTTVGGSPAGIAHGDVDADGRVDLLVTNGSGSTLTVLRGQANGSFTLRSFTTPLAPRELVLADIDADGIADALMACAATNQLAVLSGTGAVGVGDGGFAAARTLAAGSSPTALAVADLNGDLRPDAVVANTGAGTLWRYLGACAANADSTLALLSPAGGEPWWPGLPQSVRWQKGAAVTAVDLELSGDGGATWQPLASSVTGTEAVVFAPPPITPDARMRVRDSHVAARSVSSAAAFDVCGLVLAPVHSPAGLPAARLAIAADFDGDGTLDAAMANDTALAIARGMGDGTFAPMAHAPAAAPRALAAADLDRDDRMDLVVLEGEALSVRAGGELDAAAAQLVALAAAGHGLAIADLDADGDLDAAVVTGTAEAGALLVLHGDDAGHLALASTHALAAPGMRVLAADLDGDGAIELTLTTATTLEVWRSAAGGWSRASERLLAAPVGDLAWGDFDHDGRLDLAACLSATGDVWRFRGTGAALGFGAPSAFHAGSGPAHLGVTDWNGDGHADLALSAVGAAGLALLLGDAAVAADGGAFVAAEQFGDAASSGAALAIADFDGDGAPDALLATSSGVLELHASQCAPQRPATLAWTQTPSPAEATQPGESLTLRWERGPAVALVAIELSRDDGAHWEVLVPATAASEWRWRVGGPATAAARLRVRDAVVGGRSAGSAAFAIAGAALDVSGSSARALTLSLAWPMPARGSARLQLTLPHAAAVRIEVLDLQGRRVRLLSEGALGAGAHTIEWDGRDDRGAQAAPGITFVRATCGAEQRTRRVLRIP